MKRALLVGLVPALLLAGIVVACEEAPPPAVAKAPAPVGPPIPPAQSFPEERHLQNVRQLTLSGENAEAYWSNDGSQLILQARGTGDKECDRIHRMPLDGIVPPPPNGERGNIPFLVPVSNGKGATTCSYFLPGDKKVIYASTQLGGDACPPKPDHSLGYVWALYDTYDIFKADADGKNIERLTTEKGYDAEGTVCAKDGSIVFTSTRDNDIELYRMDSDGKNVKRLTNTPGYDGGAFFNADCSKIVYRASRPRPGKELEDFQKLLAQGLVRPSKLELMIMNGDGTEQTQLTYLDAASFAPFWHPSQKRILFSSNYGDPKGREFDIWAIDTAGTNLERITYAPGFDGFPMFSPDGQTLAFSSNRATPQGQHDTNVFVASWAEDQKGPILEQSSDRILKDITWLADPAREGRGIGLPGLEASGAYLEARYKELGLAPAGDGGTYRQSFPVVTSLKSEATTAVSLDGQALANTDYVVMGYSPAKADVKGDFVFADYGIVAKELGFDDYAKLDVKKKIVVVRRFAPEGGKLTTTDLQRRYGDIRRKAFSAREAGAAALVVVDDPSPPTGAAADWKQPAEAHLPSLAPEGYSDAGLPVIVLTRAAGHPLIDKLAKKGHAGGAVKVDLTPVSQNAFNVVAKIEAAPANGKKLPGAIVIGAHYDHLGKGSRYSLAPGSDAVHPGADDNASGTAVLLEVARDLASKKTQLSRDVIFVSFSGEESGILGSAHLVHEWVKTAKAKGKLENVYAMLNMDMVGRMRENRLQVLGAETAGEWNDLASAACDKAKVNCALSGDGYGPSDHTSFYAAGVPVLHFFTGSHGDYHKPSDTADKINAGGAMQVGKIVSDIALATSTRAPPLTFKAGAPGGNERGDQRTFNASLGTIPDYGGPPGKKGVLLAGVRPGSGADQGGLKKGDVLIRLGKSDLAGVEDLMYVLNSSKPGETVSATVLRDGKEMKMDVTFQESKAPRR